MCYAVLTSIKISIEMGENYHVCTIYARELCVSCQNGIMDLRGPLFFVLMRQ
jgi:hypothetical protein